MNNLKKLREEHQLSLGDLSKELSKKGFKIGRASLNNYEREEQTPKQETWKILADYFKVSVPYMMGLSDNKNDEALKNSEEVAKFIQSKLDIQEISDFMEELVASGNLELSNKSIQTFAQVTVLLSSIADNKNSSFRVDKLNEILFSVSKILDNSIFLDISNIHSENKFKDIKTVIDDFQKELSNINEALASVFSDTLSKIYK